MLFSMAWARIRACPRPRDTGLCGSRPGPRRFMANFDLVRRKGTLINVGNASGAVEPISPLKLAPKNLKLVRPR